MHSIRSTMTAALVLVGLVACSSPDASVPEPAVTTVVVTQTPSSATSSTSPAPTWQDAYASWHSGVARVAATGCGGTGSGSGFLIADDALVTAYHVVEGATAVSLRFGSQVVSGETVAADTQADLAVVRLRGTVSATPFAFAGAEAGVGAPVAVLGYPWGEPLGMTLGAVTATDLRIGVGDQERRGVFRTDAAINPGNSGGPVITVDGEVVGVVDAASPAPGDGYAIGLPTVSATLDSWRNGELAAPETTTCQEDWAALSSDAVATTVSTDHPDAPSIAQTMQLYAESINAGYMDTVWALLTPAMRANVGGYDEYARGLSTSAWHWIDVEDVTVVDDTTDTAVLAFRTTQSAADGPDGATCSDWKVTYTLVLDGGSWQIDKARLTGGAPPTVCTDDASGDPTGD